MIEHATGGPNQRCTTNCPHPRAFTRHHDHRTNPHVLIVYILDRMCVRTGTAHTACSSVLFLQAPAVSLSLSDKRVATKDVARPTDHWSAMKQTARPA